MDVRLVFAKARGRCAEGVLHSAKSARRPPAGQLRRAPARRQNPAQGDQGRLAPVRAELLPPLPAGGAACGGDRYLHESRWLSLREEESIEHVIVSLQRV